MSLEDQVEYLETLLSDLVTQDDSAELVNSELNSEGTHEN